MNKLILQRLETCEEGTFGVLNMHGLTFHTGELPWRFNNRMISCIPSGNYDCELTFSQKFQKNTYELIGVPGGRTWIRIHSGNWCGDKGLGFNSDVLGCILLGMHRARLKGQHSVIDSRAAIDKFEDALKGDKFVLSIRDIEMR